MTVTPDEAQAYHEEQQKDSILHDRVSCWCCCLDCEFTYDIIISDPGRRTE